MASGVVPATDRGLAYGDGVFRTLAVRGHRPVRWERQYAKLEADCARLGITCPPSGNLHQDVLAVTVDHPDAAVKIIVTRGEGERGYRMPEKARPNRIVISTPLAACPGSYATEGIRTWLCRTRLGTQTALAGVKHLNRLESVLARAEWDDDSYAEGILRDGQGTVICGTMTNLFIVEANRLTTPDLARCGVAGLTRDLVLEAAGRAGVAASVETLPLDRVMAADEVFLVNSLVGLWPVRAIGDAPLHTGTMAHRVREWLDECPTPG